MDPLSCSNANLEMLVFVEEGKLENSKENRRRTNKKLMALTRNQTQATLAGSECSQRRCAITALHIHCFIEMLKKLLPVINNLHLMLSLFDFISGCS